MAKAVIMPALGMAQDTGLIIEWLKHEGDMVEVGDVLMEVETDKATAEIEAESAGVLTNVSAFAGDDVPVAAIIGWLLAPGEALPAEAANQWRSDEEVVVADTAVSPPVTSPNATPVASRMAAENNVDLTAVQASGKKITKQDIQSFLAQQAPTNGNYRLAPASPLARRLADEQEIELAQLIGSGPHGAILASDVRAYEQPVAQPSVAKTAVSAAWHTMANRLSQAWTAVPHFYLTREVDCTNLMAWWQVAKNKTDNKATITDLLVKAVAVALEQHPQVNASWLNNDIVFNSDINMGLAVAVEDGLLVPVIPHANQLNLAQISTARAGIVSRALEGKPKLQDLQGGTFAISNLGMFGIDAFNAIVNPPNAGILAVGKITDRVVPHKGEIIIRPMMVLTASFDHRVVDGARGAKFLRTLVQYLEEPLSIL